VETHVFTNELTVQIEFFNVDFPCKFQITGMVENNVITAILQYFETIVKQHSRLQDTES